MAQNPKNCLYSLKVLAKKWPFLTLVKNGHFWSFLAKTFKLQRPFLAKIPEKYHGYFPVILAKNSPK